MIRRSTRAKPIAARPTSNNTDTVNIQASTDLRVEVTPSRYGPHVVVLEKSPGQLGLRQSMNFDTESQFVDWHETDHRLHRFPGAYAKLKTHVLRLIREHKAS